MNGHPLHFTCQSQFLWPFGKGDEPYEKNDTVESFANGGKHSAVDMERHDLTSGQADPETFAKQLLKMFTQSDYYKKYNIGILSNL